MNSLIKKKHCLTVVCTDPSLFPSQCNLHKCIKLSQISRTPVSRATCINSGPCWLLVDLVSCQHLSAHKQVFFVFGLLLKSDSSLPSSRPPLSAEGLLSAPGSESMKRVHFRNIFSHQGSIRQWLGLCVLLALAS